MRGPRRLTLLSPFSRRRRRRFYAAPSLRASVPFPCVCPALRECSVWPAGYFASRGNESYDGVHMSLCVHRIEQRFGTVCRRRCNKTAEGPPISQSEEQRDGRHFPTVYGDKLQNM